ncbi:MAG: ribonuclease R [Bacteroidetes bacterium]|nr:ribonuclease R [Bacteroidota bacterium]
MKAKKGKPGASKPGSQKAPKTSASSKTKPAPKAEERTPGVISELQGAILQVLLEKPDRLHNLQQIQEKLAPPQDKADAHHIIGALQDLAKRKYVEEASKLRFVAAMEHAVVDGKLINTQGGIQMVQVPELARDILLVNEGRVPAMVGDLVRVRITKLSGKGLRGMFTRVVQPLRTRFVGTVDVEANGRMFVIPQDGRIKKDFLIPKEHHKDARQGEKVVVELMEWDRDTPIARIDRVIGKAGDHNTEMHAIVLEYGLPLEFDERTLAEAAGVPDAIPAEEIARRRDFRQVPTFTIDPEDAKDFDDAISFRKMEDGLYEIGVHIADVSHYVRPGSALDNEAQERATSVYLVDRTIPMLPEKLSNNLCSLVPHQDRLCFSAVFVLDEQGKVKEEWFGRTVIHSQRRFSYEEAQVIIDTGEGDLADILQKCNQIAQQMRLNRFKAGSITFETEEVRFRLDENGVPLSVYVKERKDVHKMIEDFMLLANRRVSQFIHNFRKSPPVPFPNRVHPQPEEIKLTNLKTFVQSFGYDIDIEDPQKLAQSMNKLVLDTWGQREADIINSMAIRSMPKAYYSIQNIGHYGLGFKYYAHFTSPIRRYPDVLTHRVLQQVLDKHVTVQPGPMEALCKKCSEQEKKAADAERASIKYKQVEYLGKVLGQEFDGMITGVTEWGMYVELDGNKCEGMVPLRTLRDDHYTLEERNHRLVGKRTRRIYKLGDRVRVRVVKTSLEKRIIDFELSGKPKQA